MEALCIFRLNSTEDEMDITDITFESIEMATYAPYKPDNEPPQQLRPIQRSIAEVAEVDALNKEENLTVREEDGTGNSTVLDNTIVEQENNDEKIVV